MLETRGITHSFGGHAALIDVSVDAPAGTVTGLIGPNGAGKTTLFDVVCGLCRPDAGMVRLDGVDVTGARPFRRARLGLARTFQRLELFGSLSVRENLQVALEGRKLLAGSADAARIDEVLALVGLEDVAGSRAEELPTGRARLVEVARALVTEPHVLLLDEPASGLDERESDALAGLLGDLAARGIAVLLVEHDVRLVMRACARVLVLDRGRLIAEGTPEQVQADATVLDAYLGTGATR